MMIRVMILLLATMSLAACASPRRYTAQLEQDRQACAAVGFEPGDGEFDQCVRNLGASIAEVGRHDG
jgi:hypothetical protein